MIYLSLSTNKGIDYTILREWLGKDICTFQSIKELTLNIDLKARLVHFQRQGKRKYSKYGTMRNMEKIQDCKMVETGSCLKVKKKGLREMSGGIS